MNNPMTTDHGVGAYAGFPLLTSTGQTLGTLCVLDTKPRQWTQSQLEQLASLAAAVSTTIEYRSAAQATHPALEEASASEADNSAASFLAEAISAYLTRLDEYRRSAERVASTEELAQEAYWRQQVLATETEVRAATERYTQRSTASTEQAGSAGDTAMDELARACEHYFDAQQQRAEALTGFQQSKTSLDQVERAGGLMLQAEQALRSAARSYSLRAG
jgi:GAF domain-containing protein